MLNGSDENPRMKGEPLPVLATVLAHESLHQDNEQGQNEEVMAKWLEKVVWAEFLLADPALVEVGTPIARTLNLELLMWLNSGEKLPYPGLKPPPGSNTQVAPGSTGLPYESYEEFLRKHLYQRENNKPTPSNPLVAQIFGIPRTEELTQFDRELLSFTEKLKPFTQSELANLCKSCSLCLRSKRELDLRPPTLRWKHKKPRGPRMKG